MGKKIRRLMRVPEVSERTGIPRGTLAYMRSTGTGPRWFKLGPSKGSSVAYYEDDVDDWLDERYENTGSGAA